MVKINIGGYELDFKKEYVEKFEKTVFDSFEKTAEVYLLTHFKEKSVDKIFENHTIEEIISCIMECAELEIKLFSGEL